MCCIYRLLTLVLSLAIAKLVDLPQQFWRYIVSSKSNLKKLPLNFPVAARDRQALEVYFGAGNVRPYPGRDPDDLLVITGKDGQTQVWVRPLGDDGTFNAKYRKDYETVMNISIPNGIDIDHIQSKTRAGQQGYKYVQLTPLKLEVNRAWGGAGGKKGLLILASVAL